MTTPISRLTKARTSYKPGFLQAALGEAGGSRPAAGRTDDDTVGHLKLCLRSSAGPAWNLRQEPANDLLPGTGTGILSNSDIHPGGAILDLGFSAGGEPHAADSGPDWIRIRGACRERSGWNPATEGQLDIAGELMWNTPASSTEAAVKVSRKLGDSTPRPGSKASAVTGVSPDTRPYFKLPLRGRL